MKRILLVGIVGTMCAGMVATEKTVPCGEVVTIKATPKEHCHFVRWSDNNTNALRQVTVEEAMTLTAIFAQDATYTLSLASNNPALGEVTITAGAKERYYAGDQVTIKATPKDGCRRFLYWADDHDNTTPTRTITIKAGTNSYTAVFEIPEYTLTIQSENETMGSVEFVP